MCPAILRDQYVVHVSFNARIIKHALDRFPSEYASRALGAEGNRHYNIRYMKPLACKVDEIVSMSQLDFSVWGNAETTFFDS